MTIKCCILCIVIGIWCVGTGKGLRGLQYSGNKAARKKECCFLLQHINGEAWIMVFLKVIHHLTWIKKAHFRPSPLLLLSAMTILPRISCLYLVITAYLYLVIFGHFEWGPQHSLLFSSHKMVQCICTEYSALHLCGGEKKSKKVSFCT